MTFSLASKKRRVKSYVDDTKLLISFKIKESSEAFANLTDDLHRMVSGVPSTTFYC